MLARMHMQCLLVQCDHHSLHVAVLRRSLPQLTAPSAPAPLASTARTHARTHTHTHTVSAGTVVRTPSERAWRSSTTAGRMSAQHDTERGLPEPRRALPSAGSAARGGMKAHSSPISPRAPHPPPPSLRRPLPHPPTLLPHLAHLSADPQHSSRIRQPPQPVPPPFPTTCLALVRGFPSVGRSNRHHRSLRSSVFLLLLLLLPPPSPFLSPRLRARSSSSAPARHRRRSPSTLRTPSSVPPPASPLRRFACIARCRVVSLVCCVVFVDAGGEEPSEVKKRVLYYAGFDLVTVRFVAGALTGSTCSASKCWRESTRGKHTRLHVDGQCQTSLHRHTGTPETHSRSQTRPQSSISPRTH